MIDTSAERNLLIAVFIWLIFIKFLLFSVAASAPRSLLVNVIIYYSDVNPNHTLFLLMLVAVHLQRSDIVCHSEE